MIRSRTFVLDSNASTKPLQLTELGCLRVETSADLSIPHHDYESYGYTGSNLTTITYKQGGSSGDTVATMTIAYDEEGRPTSRAVTVL
jgi:hypothetical protein